MKYFTTLRIFHGNYCIVHPTIFSLKKIVLQEHILTITHKTQPFLLFSAFSHMSSLCQKFKALLTEEEKMEWGRSESERDWKGGERNSPDTAELGMAPYPAENLQQEPWKSISVPSAWPAGLWGHRDTSRAGSQLAALHSSQGCEQHCERAGNKKQHQAPHGCSLRGSSCT